MMEPLLAVDCCVPNVIKTCAGNCPNNASKKNTFKSLSFLFLFFFTSLYTKGSIKIVASSIGINTVLKAPTWFCTNLMQVNCKDHIKLQANKAPQDKKDFFIQNLIHQLHCERVHYKLSLQFFSCGGWGTPTTADRPG